MGTMPKRPTKSAEQIYNENPDLKRKFDTDKSAKVRADLKIKQLVSMSEKAYGERLLDFNNWVNQLQALRAAGDATEIDAAISWVDNKLAEDDAEQRRNLPMTDAERRKALTDARRK